MKSDEKLREMILEYHNFDIILAEKYAQRSQVEYLTILRAKYHKLDEIVNYLIENNIQIWEV